MTYHRTYIILNVAKESILKVNNFIKIVKCIHTLVTYLFLCHSDVRKITFSSS